ncbi:DUF2935 domain-containing protein [Tissierella sp. Yu-01]|uniref:DUF2935 domain-containing protein n=1 Tax=Tissierella sp. Yu-01 TaxID=3035694 RepID=UPI00240DFA25|nr:DUF2935 domain-containing protein [Tissierella sp. Yu-01]WFA10086.1 DUF2935 domain-containing protein [Tissierella sp. Yu-01]
MSNQRFLESALFEHRFWLQILGDHSRFILNTLSPNETEKIQRARYFIRVFDELLQEARRSLGERELEELTITARVEAEEIREFKLQLIKEHLIGMIIIELSPTFINHMVNEVDEYLRVIHCIFAKKMPVVNPLHDHNLWLPDASGHAGSIYCGLDSTERDLRKKSKEFMKLFEDLYIKADEFTGYLRTNLQDFPALHRLNKLVEDNISLFMEFLKELEKMRLTKKALGTLMPLMADHMFREECYYLFKLSEKTDVNRPNCDPTAPRLEN